MKLAVIRGVMRCGAATGGLDGAVRKAGAMGRTNGAWRTTPDGGAPLDIPTGGAADLGADEGAGVVLLSGLCCCCAEAPVVTAVASASPKKYSLHKQVS